MYENLAILAAFVLLYSLVSGGLEKTPFNGAVVFTAFGLVLGPLGLGALTLEVDAELLSMLAELTLALVLFTDASNANLRELKHSFKIPPKTFTDRFTADYSAGLRHRLPAFRWVGFA